MGENLTQVCNCGSPATVLHCSDTCRILNNALTSGTWGSLGADFFWGEMAADVLGLTCAEECAVPEDTNHSHGIMP